MRSLCTSLLLLSVIFAAHAGASGTAERVDTAAGWPPVWTHNWRADDGQQLDDYQVVNVSGMIAVSPAVVAQRCGDFDGCTIRVIKRYSFMSDPLCGAGAGESSARFFTDESAGWWIVHWTDGTLIEGLHGDLEPERIYYWQSSSQPGSFPWSFQDDYIPPGTFDLSFGFECHNFCATICCYRMVCALRIED